MSRVLHRKWLGLHFGWQVQYICASEEGRPAGVHQRLLTVGDIGVEVLLSAYVPVVNEGIDYVRPALNFS